MDTNVDRIDGESSNEIDEQEVLQSSNYGTFISDVAQQEHNEVHKAVSAGEQQPATSATDTDEFENEDMQPRHQQQQTPVLIDIEEEVIQHSPDLNKIMEEHSREVEDIYFLRHYSFSLLL